MPPLDLLGTDRDLEEAWDMFVREEATDWKWPPSQLADQDEVLLHNLFEIRTVVGRLRRPLNG
jgi:hypothetical protein